MAQPRGAEDRDDPYGDEDRPHRRPRSDADSGNVAVKIVAILGAVFLGIAVICGGTVALIWYAVGQTMTAVSQNMHELVKEAGRWQDAQAAAETFLREVRKKNFDKAYEATSKAYREQTTRAAFEEYVTHRPAIRSVDAQLIPQNPMPGGKHYTFQFTQVRGGKPVHVRLEVVEEDGIWKIDDLEAD